MSLKLLPPGARKGNPYFLAIGYHKGRYIEKSLRTADPEEAETRFLELQLGLRKQQPAGEPFTFKQACELYRETHELGRQQRRWLDDLCGVLGDRQGATITTADLTKAALKLYPKGQNATRNRQAIGPAAAVLHYASENGKVPWLRVRKLKERAPEARAVSEDTATVLIANATEPVQKALLVFLFKQGWRISEVLRLTWADLNLGQLLIRRFDRKANVEAWGPLHPAVAETLSAVTPAAGRVGRVFPWGSKSNVYRWLNPFCARLGIRFTPHMARHSVATWAVNKGATPLDLMAAYGWKDVKSVQRYGRVDAKRARKVLQGEI